MAQLVKQWSTGTGNLSVTYEGSGDGEAVFSSDTNEGIDREMSVTFEGGGISVERQVTQEGLRQRFITADGKVFCISGGGRFAVLKEGGVEPPTPEEPTIETYTRLTYIECTGKQYINTGYVVQEDDIIEMSYITTAITSYDKAMFGVVQSGKGLWATIYSNSSYVRFGSTSSVTVSNARIRYKITLKKGSVVIDDLTGAPVFSELPNLPLYLFASNGNDTSVNMYGYCQSMGFKISKASGEVVMNLKPYKRNEDGKIGMLDLVSGKFFSSEGGEEFIGGNEIRVADGYEIVDTVSFNNDKAFDTNYYGNNTTYIDVMFARTDISGADYLYGCSTGNRLTAYLPASGTGYWRYGDAYKTLNTASKKIYSANISPKSIYLDGGGGTISPAAFTTSWTLPLGGHKGSNGNITKTYQGYVYYFRMWHGDYLLLDWYPCKRKSDGVEGFWDCVSQTFIEPV